VLLLVGVIGMLGYNFTVLLPLVARYVLHWGPAGFGILTAAMGVGSLCAALAVAYGGRPSERTLLIGASAFSALFFALGLSHWGVVTVPLLVALGGASIVFTSTANTRLQLLTPPELRGRVMSIYSLLFMGTTPIGGLIIGVLAEQVGVQSTVAILAAGCGAGVVAAAIFARWMRRRMHDDAARGTRDSSAETRRARADEDQPKTPNMVSAATPKAPASARK
jgi:MFS family permease